MDLMWFIVGIVGVVVLLLIILLVYYWNKIIGLGNRIKNSWAQIDVQLKKRVDLVPI